jgi:uncharacterized membrane protein required for colicin V production
MISLSLLGWRQGVVRVLFSMVGIVLAALLAAPLSKVFAPLLGMFGVKNTIVLGIVPPLIGFALVMTVFKVAGYSVYKKVDVHFRYAGDLRLALWQRLDHRLGLCLGIFNGAFYFILIAWGIYALSYWTAQASTSGNEPTSVKMLNSMGKDLDSTRFDHVTASIDPLSKSYYDFADLVGVIYNNPLTEARLSRYPGFLDLAQRAEFQDIANDSAFTEMRQRHAPVNELISYPKTQAILKNSQLMKEIRSVVLPNITDLETYLRTGMSPKYDQQPILGSWVFDLNYTMYLFHRTKPNISSTDFKKEKQVMASAFSQATIIATPQSAVYMKNVPRIAGGDLQAAKGKWEGDSGKYIISIENGKSDISANVEKERLLLTGEGLELAFTHAD